MLNDNNKKSYETNHHENIKPKLSTPSSSSSKESFNLFEDCNSKTDSDSFYRSRHHSPFLLRKSKSQLYNYNPFISSNGDLDQISRISSTPSTNTIRTDSGLSSLDSTQLLCAELKECLEKGESYSTIEIKFRKNLYAFWSLDDNGNSIFHLAAKYGTLSVLRTLVAKYPDKWYVTNKLGETAMQSAIDNGNLESFKYLLQLKIDENVDINQILDHEGNSLLSKSIIYNQYEFVKYLTEYCPNLVTTKNCYGAYPIHLAAVKGNMQILRLISRESKKYVNERDSKGLTPAMYAAQDGHYECLKYLLDNAGAKYNKIVKSNKYTLLHLGVRSGSLDVVQYLIMKMGTSFLKCRTKEGATVYHLAAASGNDQILDYLLAIKIAKTLKNVKDVVGSTAAHDAAENGHFKCLKLLYDAGLNMFEEDMEHATPYSLSLKSENPECVEFASSLQVPSISNDSSQNESNANNTSTFTKFNLRRLSSMLRQRRAKPMNGSPLLYTQKLRPAPVSLPHSSTITGIQNSVHQLENEDELNDAAIDAILNQINMNSIHKGSIIHSHSENADGFRQQQNYVENVNDGSTLNTSRLSRYSEHQQQQSKQDNNQKGETYAIGLKLKQSLSSSRESTPTLIRASRSGTPTPLLQSLANDQVDNTQSLNKITNNTDFNNENKFNNTSIKATQKINLFASKKEITNIQKEQENPSRPSSETYNRNEGTDGTGKVKHPRFYKISTKYSKETTETNNIVSKENKINEVIEYNNPNNPSNAYKLLNQKKSVVFEDEVKFMDNEMKRNYRSESLPLSKHNEILAKLQMSKKLTESQTVDKNQLKKDQPNYQSATISYQNSFKMRESTDNSIIDRKNMKVILPKQYDNNRIKKSNKNYNNDNNNTVYNTNSQIYEPVPDYWDYDVKGNQNDKNNLNTNSYEKESSKASKEPLTPPLPLLPSYIHQQYEQQDEKSSSSTFPLPPPPPTVTPPAPPITKIPTNNKNIDSSPATSVSSNTKSEPISLAEVITKSLSYANQKITNGSSETTIKKIDNLILIEENSKQNEINIHPINNLNKQTTTTSNDNVGSVTTRVVALEQFKETNYTSKQSNSSPLTINSSSTKKSQELERKRSSENNANNTNTNSTKTVNYSTNIYVNVDSGDDNSNIYSVPNNPNDNIYVTNVQVYSNRVDVTNYNNNNINNRNGHLPKKLDLISDDDRSFPSPPTQNLARVASFEEQQDQQNQQDHRTPSPSWPPPPPPATTAQSIKLTATTASSESMSIMKEFVNLQISTESLMEAKQRMLMKKENAEAQRPPINNDQINNRPLSGNNQRGRIADSLLKEMQKHKLYNTSKDYILNYLDRSNNPKDLANNRNAVRIYNANMQDNTQNNDEIKDFSEIKTNEVKIYLDQNNVTVIDTEVKNSPKINRNVPPVAQIQPHPQPQSIQTTSNTTSTIQIAPMASYDRFPYIKNKNLNNVNNNLKNNNLSKSIQLNETNNSSSSTKSMSIENINNNSNGVTYQNGGNVNNSNNKNQTNHDRSSATIYSSSSGSKINGSNNSLNINNNNNLKNNRKFEANANVNNNNNESELDRVFKKRAMQNQN